MAIRASAAVAPRRTRQPRVKANRRSSIVCVASRFNTPITQRLVDGAVRTFTQRGLKRRDVRVLWVPGAFELPIAAAWAARHLKPMAIVAVGCVLKGETPQYAAIGHAVASGLTQVSVQTNTPVGFGDIVADSLAKARARDGGNVGNRGTEAATAVIKRLELKHRL